MNMMAISAPSPEQIRHPHRHAGPCFAASRGKGRDGKPVDLLDVKQVAAPASQSRTFTHGPGGKAVQERRSEMKYPLRKFQIPGGDSFEQAGRHHQSLIKFVCVL